MQTTMKRLGGLLVLILTAGCAHQAPPVPVPKIEQPALPPAPQGYESADAIRAAVDAGDLAPIPEPGPLPDDVVLTGGVVYAEPNGEPLVLDIYAPKKRDGLAPGLLFIHGGGWRGGSRDFYAAWCRHFAQKGYVCATVQYRFSDKAIFPAAVDDAMNALRWLFANAEAWGIDARRIGVVGQSAGAHLALMTAYAPELQQQLNLHNAQLPRPAMVIAFYPPTDFTREGVRGIDPVQWFLGTRYVSDPDLYALASPITHATADDPPTLLVHGTVDDVVPVDQSDMLAAKLKELGVPVWYDRMEGWHHAMDLYVPAHDHCLRVVEMYVEAYLPLND